MLNWMQGLMRAGACQLDALWVSQLVAQEASGVMVVAMLSLAAGDNEGGDHLGVRGGSHDEGDGEGGWGGRTGLVTRLIFCKKK